MIVKYKVSDFAKDLNLSAKKVLDELNAMGSTGKKNSSNLEENELNYLLEKFSKDNSVADLDEFLTAPRLPRKSPRRRRRRRRSTRPPRPKRSRSSPLPRRPSLPSRIITITTSTVIKRTSSTRSARKRPFPSASWPVRPAPRHPLPPHRPCPCAARTIR